MKRLFLVSLLFASTAFGDIVQPTGAGGSGDLLAANNLSDLINVGTARTNLALAIGTNVQAYDADLTTYAGITPAANVQTFLGAANYAAMKTQLALTIGTDVQAVDADLTSWAAITRASGFDTFTTTATSANFLSLVSNETGTGVLMGNVNPTIDAFTFTGSAGAVPTTAGKLDYDTTSNSMVHGDGTSTFMVFNETLYRLAANGSAVGPTIADVFPTGSAFPTATNGIYLMMFDLHFLKTTAGTVTFTLLNSQTYTNVTGFITYSATAGEQSHGTAPGNGFSTITAGAAAFAASGSLSTAVNHHVYIYAAVECATAGNIRLQVTSSAGTVTSLRDSYYTVKQLPAGNVGTFVN